MIRLAVAVLFAMPLLTCAAPIPKTLKKKAVSLEGKWLWHSVESQNETTAAPPSDYRTWVVEADTMQLIRTGNGVGGNLVEPCKFVSKVNTHGILTFEYTVNSNGYNRKGVCTVDGETLRVKFGNKNEEDEDVKPDPNTTVYVFSRSTDGK